MSERELIRIAERAPLVEDQIEAMKKLRAINPTYHRCPEWDYMVICNENAEYDCCICEPEKKDQPF